MSSRRSLSPATVTADGLLIAATDTRRPNSSSIFPSIVPHQRFGVEADGEHPALPAGALLESASVVDHLDRLLEGEQTGEMVGGHFTGAVADHGIGSYPELLRAARPVRSEWRSWPVARSPSPPCENGSHRVGARRARDQSV